MNRIYGVGEVVTARGRDWVAEKKGIPFPSGVVLHRAVLDLSEIHPN